LPRETAATGDAADLALVRRVREGEEGAYAQLWRRFGQPLYGFAVSRLGGDGELAEEVVVHTLAAAVSGIGRFRPRRSTLSAWVYGIARRHICVELRRRRRRGSVPAAALVSLKAALARASDDPTPALVARLEAFRKVDAMAQHLSDTEMEVLLLHFGEGLSVREVARVIGRSRRAADSVLHRAKSKVRERLVGDAG